MGFSWSRVSCCGANHAKNGVMGVWFKNLFESSRYIPRMQGQLDFLVVQLQSNVRIEPRRAPKNRIPWPWLAVSTIWKKMVQVLCCDCLSFFLLQLGKRLRKCLYVIKYGDLQWDHPWASGSEPNEVRFYRRQRQRLSFLFISPRRLHFQVGQRIFTPLDQELQKGNGSWASAFEVAWKTFFCCRRRTLLPQLCGPIWNDPWRVCWFFAILMRVLIDVHAELTKSKMCGCFSLFVNLHGKFLLAWLRFSKILG